VQFRIKHLAYSWLYGGFNDFSGTFTYDTEDTSNSGVELTINTASLDSNHAERDKHLRGKDFLDVERYPQASFKSTAYKETGFNTSVLEGELTLKGITKPVRIEVQRIGNGPDPWGGYRRGFQGSTSFALKDFGIDYDLGPAARKVEMILSIEGVRRQGYDFATRNNPRDPAMQPRAALMGLSFLAIVTLSHASGLGRPITIVIVNPGFDERMIEVVDNICREVVISATLAAESSVRAHVCTRGMDKGDVTIRNTLTGAQQRHADIIGDARLTAP
jgi:polyisoprenoid-binding protein YceI